MRDVFHLDSSAVVMQGRGNKNYMYMYMLFKRYNYVKYVVQTIDTHVSYSILHMHIVVDYHAYHR